VPFLVTPECTNLSGQNAMSCPNLYNGTSVVTAAGQQATPSVPAIPVNTLITTIPAPLVDATTTHASQCSANNGGTLDYTGQKNCAEMQPVLVVGRS
jgi:hypothetical protein